MTAPKVRIICEDGDAWKTRITIDDRDISDVVQRMVLIFAPDDIVKAEMILAVDHVDVSLKPEGISLRDVVLEPAESVTS
jgi:hypothetical protein